MTRQILITAAVVGALASPLTASDQSVEKATRYRAVAAEAAEPVQLPEAVSHDATDVPVVFEAQTEELGAFVENDSSAQIEELGQCCYIWAVNAEQVEELGGKDHFFWQNAEQIEELGGKDRFIWAVNAEQVEDLGPGMLNHTEQVEELGGKDRFHWNQNAEQVEDLGCCYMWNQ